MIVTLPILIPLGMAAASMLAWRRPNIQWLLGVVSTAVQLAVTVWLATIVARDGIQVVQIGNWPAPYGITLVADHLSAIMLLTSTLLGFAVAVYSGVSIDSTRQSFAYYPLLLFLLAGVSGAFMTGDVFNLYVWFEVLLVSSFVLMTLGGERAQLEGGIKYVTVNLVASFLFLIAIGILYGAVGTLNLADIAVKLPRLGNRDLVATLGMLFLIAFGIKAAVFPLFFWLPASYHTPPHAVSAIFAGLLTKVGVYAIIRTFTLVFPDDSLVTHRLILILAGLTMVTGVLGAVAHHDFRRILSFHIISQIGYMILGLGLFTPAGISGAIYFVVHNILAKSNLFLVSGVAHWRFGTDDLNKQGGLYREMPLLALMFAVSAFSLAGIPPLSGFVGKLALVQAGLAAHEYALVAVSLAVGLLTLYSMTKIWLRAFWQPHEVSEEATRHGNGNTFGNRMSVRQQFGFLSPICVLAACTVGMGVAAGPVLRFTDAAAHELLEPAGSNGYIERVLGAAQ